MTASSRRATTRRPEGAPGARLDGHGGEGEKPVGNADETAVPGPDASAFLDAAETGGRRELGGDGNGRGRASTVADGEDRAPVRVQQGNVGEVEHGEIARAPSDTLRNHLGRRAQEMGQVSALGEGSRDRIETLDLQVESVVTVLEPVEEHGSLHLGDGTFDPEIGQGARHGEYGDDADPHHGEKGR